MGFKSLVSLFSAAVLIAGSATALTLKTGQVFSNGQVYDGASPEQEAHILKTIENGGETAGVATNSVYVVVEGNITYIPLSELQGKEKEEIEVIIKDAITEDLTSKLARDILGNSAAQALQNGTISLEEAAERAAIAGNETLSSDIAKAVASEALEAAVASGNQAAIEAAHEAAEAVGALVDTTSDLAKELEAGGYAIEYDNQGNVVDPR